MQLHITFSMALCAVAWCDGLAAQIVVTGGGANLANAVAAAPDGAVLLVQPGAYDGFTMSGKGLTILGASGVGISGTIDISNTLPFQAVTLRRLTWMTSQLSTGDKLLAFANCAGPVLIEQVTQPPHLGCLPSPAGQCLRTTGLSAAQCSQLYMRDCSLRCTVNLSASESVIESCLIEGEDYFGYSTGGINAVHPGRTALLASGGSTGVCGNTTVRGGNGNYSSLQSAFAGNGITLTAGALRLLDGQVVAGGNSQFPSHTVWAGGSAQLRISPRVALSGNIYGPQTGTDLMPQLTGASSSGGGALSGTVTTEIGDLVILAVGLPGPSLTVAGLQDPFWLDPAVHVFAALGVQQAAVPVAATVNVPASSSFQGLRLNWGAACQGPLTGFQATNPMVTLVY